MKSMALASLVSTAHTLASLLYVKFMSTRRTMICCVQSVENENAAITRLPMYKFVDKFPLFVCSHLNQTTSWTHPSSNVEHQSITVTTGDAAAGKHPPAVSMGKRSDNTAPVGV